MGKLFGNVGTTILLGGLGTLVLLGMFPVETRTSVDRRIFVSRISTYAKVTGFLHRHFGYSRLTREIVGDERNDDARVLRLFEWTKRHIKKIPPGYPLIDSHTYDIIVRRYGSPYQVADVFTTLSIYAGIPSFWERIGKWTLAFTRIGNQWKIWCVSDEDYNMHPSVDPGSLGKLDRHLTACDQTRSLNPSKKEEYLILVDRFKWLDHRQTREFLESGIFRSELQMPGPRIWYEIRKMLGVAPPVIKGVFRRQLISGVISAPPF